MTTFYCILLNLAFAIVCFGFFRLGYSSCKRKYKMQQSKLKYYYCTYTYQGAAINDVNGINFNADFDLMEGDSAQRIIMLRKYVAEMHNEKKGTELTSDSIHILFFGQM